MRISPEVERIYQQLLWGNRRRSRILSSVSAHFGAPTITRILTGAGIATSPLDGDPDFCSLLDERSPENFLAALAYRVESLEAATVEALRRHVSAYQQHVEEQILFGARTAGQEAGRAFLSTARSAMHGRSRMDVPEAVQAVFELTYSGMPWERSYFLCLRAFGGSTVHYSRSPHLAPWKEAGADPRFLYGMRSEWIRGILDILSPETEYSPSHSIEKGEPFGLAHFHLRGQHAGP